MLNKLDAKDSTLQCNEEMSKLRFLHHPGNETNYEKKV